MDFIIDTTGNTDFPEKPSVSNSALKEILQDYKTTLNKIEATKKKTQLEEPDIFQQFSKDMGWTKKRTGNLNTIESNRVNKKQLDEILKKSVITPEFEQFHAVPPYEVSKKKLQEQRKKEKEKSKGKYWFNLPATEMTDEVKHDLEVLQMRSVLDPKHFYKKNDLNVLPKYFQIGKVMDSPIDYYSNRLSKKERKKTLVDELLADAEFNKYNKRKYREIIEERQKTHYKAWRQAKRLKRKNKK